MTNTTSRSRGGPATAAASGPSMLWRLIASSWLLLLLAPAGGLAWLAFGVLALLGRRRSWGIAAGVYAAAAIVVQLPDDPAGQLLQGTLYLVILVHGLLINQRWLLLLWGRRENGLNLMGNPAGGRAATRAPAGPRQRAAQTPKEAEQLLGGIGTALTDYLADEPAQTPRKKPTRAQQRAAQRAERAERAARASTREQPSAAPTRTPTAPAPARAAPAADADLVDVNTANQRTLAKLTGMDRGLAKAAITERGRRGGFGSLEDFAATAGLQPHEIVRLRGEAFCSSRPRSKRSFGRRVDY